MTRQTYEELQAKEGPRCPYLVRILLAGGQVPSRDVLLSALRAGGDRVEVMGEKKDFLGFAYPDHVSTFAGGEQVPAQHVFTLQPGRTNDVETALRQTWDWNGVRDAVAGAQATLFMNDMMAFGVAPKVRLDLFQRALRAVLPLLRAVALHWLPSQRIVAPDAYLRADPALGPVSAGPVNVRLFRVESRSPGECVMDTLGLAAFGLPDLQCHFVGLDPGRVAARLYGYATYVFEHGDVIADGHTVEGLETTDVWACQHEESPSSRSES